MLLGAVPMEVQRSRFRVTAAMRSQARGKRLVGRLRDERWRCSVHGSPDSVRRRPVDVIRRRRGSRRRLPHPAKTHDAFITILT
jgi:hypothetical protein